MVRVEVGKRRPLSHSVIRLGKEERIADAGLACVGVLLVGHHQWRGEGLGCVGQCVRVGACVHGTGPARSHARFHHQQRRSPTGSATCRPNFASVRPPGPTAPASSLDGGASGAHKLMRSAESDVVMAVNSLSDCIVLSRKFTAFLFVSHHFCLRFHSRGGYLA
jgi:hypothetical protein